MWEYNFTDLQRSNANTENIKRILDTMAWYDAADGVVHCLCVHVWVACCLFGIAFGFACI